MKNPWNLTPRQCEGVAAFVNHACAKGAADALGIVHKRGCNLLRDCRKRMGARTNIQMALMWDRWARAIGQ